MNPPAALLLIRSGHLLNEENTWWGSLRKHQSIRQNELRKLFRVKT
jgi:hypothetical protein